MSKIAVFIGRFQPFHIGHKSVIDLALANCDKVIVIIGSSNEPRTARNPFTFEERKAMIQGAYPDRDNIFVEYSVNRYYNDTAWSNDIREKVRRYASYKDQVYLIGHAKDHSSFYLNMFPEWKSIDAPAYTINGITLNATDIRNSMYKKYHTDWSWLHLLPQSSRNVIKEIPNSTIDNMIAEWKFVEKYKEQWEDSPYPPTFVTVDAVVTQAGHVLMVHRGAHPGKGLCALPGGFINQYETIKDACIRELHEETRIDLPKPALYGSIRDSHVFDSPYRSQRGRTITHAFHLELDKTRPMPKVKGSDDAAKAFWIPLNALQRDKVYEDHADIISYFTGVEID
jgi:bifunctional NMN adenylyltransferase/nudix hydrolase